MDAETIVLLTISIIGALSSCIAILHLKKCHAFCIESECYKGNSNIATPTLVEPKFHHSATTQ